MNELYIALHVSPETALNKIAKTANNKSCLIFIKTKINLSLILFTI